MKKYWYFIVSLIILLIATFLRFYNFSARAPFDWDQNRDYQAVSKIASGNLTLVGPVAKGEGGFLLGPLYYYLVLPFFVLMQASPLALPITSILLDLSAIVAIILLMRKFLGDWGTLTLAAIYSTSFVIIETSRISWNVALVPLYSFVILWVITNNKILNSRWALAYGFLAALAWHIHAALIPLSLVVIGAKFLKSIFRYQNLGYFAIGYTFALLPLIIFDLRHMGLERHLIFEFIKTNSAISPEWSEVLSSVVSRFGKNLYAILTGRSHLQLGLGLISTLLVCLWWFKIKTSRLVSLGIITNLILVILLREPGFPEYYLQFATIGVVVLILHVMHRHLNANSALAIIVLYGLMQFPQYTATPSPFSLANKIAITQKLADYQPSLYLKTDLPYGRDFGFTSLFQYYGVKNDPNSQKIFLLTESHDPTLFIDGEIATDLGYFGGFRLGVRGVQ